MYLPTKLFFTKGVGRHKEYLSSFELALRNARIEICNLVTVSSIFPIGCKRISIDEGVKLITPGQITHCVMARNSTNEPNRLIASSIGVALPADTHMLMVIYQNIILMDSLKKFVVNMQKIWLQQCLLSTLGVEFDPEKDWSEREDIYKMSGKIVRSFNVTQSAEGDKNGLWTTVIAVGVFLP